MTVHHGDFVELAGPVAQVAGQRHTVGVVHVVLLDAVGLVEEQFLGHLAGPVARGEHLEDDLRGDSALDPLPVTAAVALRPPESDEDIRGGAEVRPALDGIPKEVAGDEHVGIGVEQGVEATLERHDPTEL